MEIWIYATGIKIVVGLGYLGFLLFVLFRRSDVIGRRVALLYLALSLLWVSAMVMTGLPAILPPDVAAIAGSLIPVFTTALAVAQLLLLCAFLELPLLSAVAGAGGMWTAVLLLTTLYFLGDASPAFPLAQLAHGGWIVLEAVLVGLLARTLSRSHLALHYNRVLYWLLTMIPLTAGQALVILFAGPAQDVGILLNLLGGIFVARGATNYWLPNIKAKLRSILRFLFLFAITAALFLGMILGAEQLVARLPLPHLALVATLAAVAALIYLPLYRWLPSLVERVGFDPARVLRDYGRTIGAILNLNQLASKVVWRVAEVLGVRRGALLVVMETGEDGLQLQPVTGLGDVPQEPLKFEPSSPILARISEDDTPLFQYEIEHHPDMQGAAQQERDWLRGLDMEVYLPIRSQGDLTGLLALGPPGTGEPYGHHALEFLSTMAQQTGVALQNARLFEGLLDRNARITQLNEDLRTAYERLERMDQSKGDFLSIASHELRTPLTQMRGYVEILIEMAETETLPQDQVLSLARSISRPTRRLEDIITAMLDASEIDVEGLALHFAPITLASTMRLSLEPWLGALEERDISLTAQGVEDVPTIHGDLERLCQAFSNLISNAIKFTPDGGRILINAYSLDEEHFEVTITDSGVGISQIDQELIFEKFYRVGSVNLHSTGQSKFKGAGPGLGLPIARGVIEGHGGCIWVESEGYDEERCLGSTFHIVLPYQAHQEPCRWKRDGN